MEKVSHFVFSRLNMRFSGIKLSEKSMLERLRLFEGITLPSILNQSNKDFKFVQITSNTLPMDIRKIQLGYSDLIEVDHEISETSKFGNDLDKIVLDYIKGNTDAEIIVCTNIDSDEAMHRNYIQMVNGHVLRDLRRSGGAKNFDKIYPLLLYPIHKVHFSIQLPYPCLLDSRRSVCSNSFYLPQSMSLISALNNPVSCFRSMHGGLSRFSKRIKSLNTTFFEVFHSLNVCQEYESNPKSDKVSTQIKDDAVIKRDFNLDLEKTRLYLKSLENELLLREGKSIRAIYKARRSAGL